VQAALKIKRAPAEKIIHKGVVFCRGKVLNQTHLKLNVGDVVEIDNEPEAVEPPRIVPLGRARFEILFEDEHLLVVEKPAGLLTVPTPNRESNTLQSQIARFLKHHHPGAQAICVHRLDRLVSGILVFAKSVAVGEGLRDHFADRKPDRVYAAIVRGTPDPASGTIRNYLSTDEKLNRRVSDDPRSGELAITHYRVKETWNDVSLLEIKLETGRRNQIRVHLAELGFPILGDPRYGGPLAHHPHWPFARIALHAESLGFVHPVTGKGMNFNTTWPSEFRELRRLALGKR
jgi:23S rRNA pseudouridine1911/1915/1917 synthase